MRRLIGFARAPGAVALAVVLLLGVGAPPEQSSKPAASLLLPMIPERIRF